MHLEKNVFESTIGVLLDIKTKTKDGLKSLMDLVNQDIRYEIYLTPATQSGKVDLLGASYNLREMRRGPCASGLGVSRCRPFCLPTSRAWSR